MFPPKKWENYVSNMIEYDQFLENKNAKFTIHFFSNNEGIVYLSLRDENSNEIKIERESKESEALTS